jgi:predicted RNase H-like HicB family nuclease
MEIPVLLEPLPGGGFQARSGDPLNLTAEGDSPDLALRKLRELIEIRLASGSVLMPLEVSGPGPSPYRGAGIYRDEPLFDAWRAAIDEYRQNIEDDPNIP